MSRYRVERGAPNVVVVFGGDPFVCFTLTDDEAEALAASLLEAVPISDEHKAILEETIQEAEGQVVPLGLQTQGGLPDTAKPVRRNREPAHTTFDLGDRVVYCLGEECERRGTVTDLKWGPEHIGVTYDDNGVDEMTRADRLTPEAP